MSEILKVKSGNNWVAIPGIKGDTGSLGLQGPTGPKGDTGDDGYSPSANVVKVGPTATITITDKTGTTTALISDGEGLTYSAGTGIDITNNTISVDDTIATKTDLTSYRTSAAQDVIDAGKQATLVSGTNIKTINSQSILGSGDIEVYNGAYVANYNTAYNTVRNWYLNGKLVVYKYLYGTNLVRFLPITKYDNDTNTFYFETTGIEYGSLYKYTAARNTSSWVDTGTRTEVEYKNASLNGKGIVLPDGITTFVNDGVISTPEYRGMYDITVSGSGIIKTVYGGSYIPAYVETKYNFQGSWTTSVAAGSWWAAEPWVGDEDNPAYHLIAGATYNYSITKNGTTYTGTATAQDLGNRYALELNNDTLVSLIYLHSSVFKVRLITSTLDETITSIVLTRNVDEVVGKINAKYMPIDNNTIYIDNGVMKAQGGGSGGNYSFTGSLNKNGNIVGSTGGLYLFQNSPIVNLNGVCLTLTATNTWTFNLDSEPPFISTSISHIVKFCISSPTNGKSQGLKSVTPTESAGVYTFAVNSNGVGSITIDGTTVSITTTNSQRPYLNQLIIYRGNIDTIPIDTSLLGLPGTNYSGTRQSSGTYYSNRGWFNQTNFGIPMIGSLTAGSNDFPTTAGTYNLQLQVSGDGTSSSPITYNYLWVAQS